MADEKHLYLTCGGAYTSGSALTETWQFGLRLNVTFSIVVPYGTLSQNWSVTPQAEQTTSGDWEIVNQFSIDGPGSGTFDVADYMTGTVIDAAEAFMEASDISSRVILQDLKLSPINASGHVILDRTVHAHNATGVPGGGGSSLLPIQNSVVVSTQTPVVGAHGRGRFYLPGVHTTETDVNGSLKTDWPPLISAAAAAFISALGTGTPDGNIYGVVTGAPYVSYGAITSVRVGNRIDTQRRRRRSLVEAYATEAVDLP